MKALSRSLPICALVGGLMLAVGGARAQALITGNDEKVWFDETGKTVNQPPGKDTVSIIDIHDPTKPRILASLPLMNTIIGPPVNLAIAPDQHLAGCGKSRDFGKTVMKRARNGNPGLIKSTGYEGAKGDESGWKHHRPTFSAAC